MMSEMIMKSNLMTSMVMKSANMRAVDEYEHMAWFGVEGYPFEGKSPVYLMNQIVLQTQNSCGLDTGKCKLQRLI